VKISENSPKLVRRSHECFQTFFEIFAKITEDFQRLPNIGEDFQGRPEGVLILHQ